MADWKKLLDDAIEQIGGAAQAAGQGLRQAAGEAGKVVGIGVGSLDLRPARTTYALGQTIRGAVILRLEEPLAARRLLVSLRATRKRTVNRSGQGATTETEVVHEFSLDLAGEQTYTSGEHEFAVELPEEIEASVDVGGFLGDVLKVSRAFRSMREGQLRWRLVATLEIPWKRNLSKAIDLHVRETPGDEEDDPPPPPPRAEPRRPRPEPPPQAETRTTPEPETAKTPEPETAETPEPGTATPPKPSPPPVPDPIPLPGGWMMALSRTLCALQGRGWVIVHHWAGPPARPEAVLEVLARHPDLDPELLLFHGVMNGLELVVGKPLVPRADYTSVRLAREAATRRGGPLGALGELFTHPGLGAPLAAEFVSRGEDAVRVLGLPTLERLLDESEDFARRDGRNVIYGAVVRGHGDYFGLTRSDEIARWRAPATGAAARAGYYDHSARAYQARLQERAREHPGQVWWVVRGEDHGATLCDPPVLLRWSEMLALCLQELERGDR